MFQKHYAEYYNLLNQKKQYKKEIEFVHKWAGHPKSIFDIGCGTASYWQHYPKGTVLLGIEKSQEMADQGGDGVFCNDIQNYNHFEALYGVFDCATALFHVLNYIPTHRWWKKLPILKGGHFIFDIFNKEKVDKDGFKQTSRSIDGISRTIYPIHYKDGVVHLEVSVQKGKMEYTERHIMNIYSEKDIRKFCGNDFEIIEKKNTETWTTWYKLRRK